MACCVDPQQFEASLCQVLERWEQTCPEISMQVQSWTASARHDRFLRRINLQPPAAPSPAGAREGGTRRLKGQAKGVNQSRRHGRAHGTGRVSKATASPQPAQAADPSISTGAADGFAPPEDLPVSQGEAKQPAELNEHTAAVEMLVAFTQHQEQARPAGAMPVDATLLSSSNIAEGNGVHGASNSLATLDPFTPATPIEAVGAATHMPDLQDDDWEDFQAPQDPSNQPGDSWQGGHVEWDGAEDLGISLPDLSFMLAAELQQPGHGPSPDLL